MASLSGLSIDLDLLDFLALGILVPWALACAKDTFRYVGHCGLVFEEFRIFRPWDFGTWEDLLVFLVCWILVFEDLDISVFGILVFDKRKAES